MGSYDLKPEDQLLLNCSLTRLSDENIKRIKQLTNQDLDWDYLINMAYKHRLSPLLYWHLNRISPEAIPSNLKLKLKEHFHKNVQKNLMMFKELLEVLDILQKQGIVPLPYKGPVLAILIYKNLGFRIFGDLDFYVPLEDVPKTRDILVNEGYEPWEKLNSAQEKSFYKFQREFHFINKSTGINLEIKWKLFSTFHSISHEPFLMGPDFLKEEKINQFKIKTISSDYLLLILSIHNATHFFSNLYRFCDLSELIKSMDNIDWLKLMNIASEIDAKRIFLVNLCVIQELFNIQLPNIVFEEIDRDNFVNRLSKDIIKHIFSQNSIGKIQKIIHPFKFREKFSNKLKNFLSITLLPTVEVIESVSLPHFLYPLYYIIRVFNVFRIIGNLVKDCL